MHCIRIRSILQTLVHRGGQQINQLDWFIEIFVSYILRTIHTDAIESTALRRILCRMYHARILLSRLSYWLIGLMLEGLSWDQMCIFTCQGANHANAWWCRGVFFWGGGGGEGEIHGGQEEFDPVDFVQEENAAYVHVLAITYLERETGLLWQLAKIMILFPHQLGRQSQLLYIELCLIRSKLAQLSSLLPRN